MSGAPQSTDVAHPHARELPPEAYRRMSQVLRVGLLIASALLLVAVFVFLRDHPVVTLSSVLSSNPIGDYLDPGDLLRGLLSGHSQAFLTLGVLVLVITPIARVSTGCWYFLRNAEREMALITAIVLVLLLVGLLVLGPLLR